MSSLEFLCIIVFTIIILMSFYIISAMAAGVLTDGQIGFGIFMIFVSLIYITVFAVGYADANIISKVETPIISYEVDDKTYQITYNPEAPVEIKQLTRYTQNKVYHWTVYQHCVFRYNFVRGE